MGQTNVIATVREEATGSIIGYRLVNKETGEIYDIRVEDSQLALTNLCIQGVTYSPDFKCLKSTTSLSLTDLPKLNEDFVLMVGRQDMGLAVLAEIYDGDVLAGYKVCTTMGQLKNVTRKNLIDLSRSMRKANYDLKQAGNDIVAVPLDGVPFQKAYIQDSKRSSYRENGSQANLADSEYQMPLVPRYSIREVTKNEFCQDATRRMAVALADLKKAFPFYAVLLEALDKRICDDSVVPTMGVTETKFLYNVKFVAQCSVPQLVFVLLHEVLHIAQQDVVRCGKRNPRLWNVATDLYNNEMICTDYGLTPGVQSTVNGVEIEPLMEGLYFSKIGEVCNLSKDMAELIYERLEQKAQKQGGGGNEKSDNSGGGGSGEGEQGEGNPSLGGGYSDASDITYNGKRLDGKLFDKLTTEVGVDTEEKRRESERISKQKIQDMDTHKKMFEQKHGVDLAKGSDCAQRVQRAIEYGLQGKIDYRQVLKNILLEKPRKKYTLATPNEMYMNLGITFADRRRIGKPQDVKNIVFALDVSGSCTDEVINRFMAEVAGIFRYYNAECEVIFWNTSVCDTGSIKNRRGIEKLNPDWSGGTNVRCVFDYLSGKTDTVTGKHEQASVRDIKAVFILTDGFFDRNYGEYEGAFGRKTIWVLDNASPVAFNPCFGRVLSLNEEE